jgi:IPT/TIG domain
MHRTVASVIVLWAMAGTVSAQLPWKLPPPVLTRIDPPSAAPGTTIDVYGKNLNPQAFVGPRVVFETRPTLISQSARAISNTQLRVVVPLGSGTVQVHVETAGGNSNAVTFVYKTPTIASLSPASGGGDQVVTIVGQGFGVKQAFDATTFVKFGDSLAQPVQWDDQKIVVKAPTDFGTGTNTNIFLGLLGCAAGYGTTTEAAKLFLDLSLPGCNELFASLVKSYQLATSQGFLERQVNVVVRTTAGASNQRVFTYKVPVEIAASGGSTSIMGAYADPEDPLDAWLELKSDNTFIEGTPDGEFPGKYKVEGELVSFQSGRGGDLVSGVQLGGQAFQLRVESGKLRQLDYPRVYVRLDRLPEALAEDEKPVNNRAPGPGGVGFSIELNERLAVGSLWTIQAALHIYYSIRRFNGPDITGLRQLGPPEGASPDADYAGLIDASLASGIRNGYRFVYAAGPPVPFGIPTYSIHADPITPGVTGRSHYYTDQTGDIRRNATRPAGPNDPSCINTEHPSLSCREAASAQSPSQMPDAIRAILDRGYPGWRPAQSSNYDITTCKQPNPDFRYWFVWGDFNDNGELDYAAETAQGTATYVIEFIASSCGFRPAVVDKFANSAGAWAVLDVVPKRAKLRDLQPTPAGGFVAHERIIQADALLGIGCEKSAVAYIYSGSGFERIFIQD